MAASSATSPPIGDGGLACRSCTPGPCRASPPEPSSDRSEAWPVAEGKRWPGRCAAGRPGVLRSLRAVLRPADGGPPVDPHGDLPCGWCPWSKAAARRPANPSTVRAWSAPWPSVEDRHPRRTILIPAWASYYSI